MSTYQRRRGLPVRIWPIVTKTDSRGNQHQTVDLDQRPLIGKAWTFPQRSANASVPGQQRINVTRIGIDADLSGVDLVPAGDLFARVEFMGSEWDVVAPPAYHHGTRHTRHWSADIRERP